MVTIKNTSRKMATFNLTAECARGGLQCVEQEVIRTVRNKRGELRPKAIMLKFPPVLTLLAGESVGNLPDAILAAPEVKAALASGAIRVMSQKSDPAPKSRKSDRAAGVDR